MALAHDYFVGLFLDKHEFNTRQYWPGAEGLYFEANREANAKQE